MRLLLFLLCALAGPVAIAAGASPHGPDSADSPEISIISSNAAPPTADEATVSGYFTWRRDQLQRINTIGDRISRAAAPDCPGGLAPFGLALAQAGQFAPTQIAAAGLNPNDSRPRVLAVAPDSAAAKAGIMAGDILALWPAASVLPGKPPTFSGVEAAAQALDDAAHPAALETPVERGTSRTMRTIRREPGCGGWFDLLQSPRLTAITTTRWIQVSEPLLRKLDQDDELAFVIGHEMAHRVMRRREGPARQTCGQRCEQQADDMALQYMVRAGYNPVHAVTALRTIAAGSRWIDVIDGRKGTLLRRVERLAKAVADGRAIPK